MKLKLFLLSVSVIILSALSADVTEKVTVKVSFPEFGDITSKTTSFYSDTIMRVDDNNDVKGKGLLGSIMSGFYPKGKHSQILDLSENKSYSIDHKKKTYTVSPIQKVELSSEQEHYRVESKQEEDQDKRYRVIRRDLKVIDTKRNEKVKQFTADLYNIIYISEIENIENGDRQIDSLFVDVFTTGKDKTITSAENEKTEFYQAYLKEIGMEMNTEKYQDMMGTEWLQMLQAMDQESQRKDEQIDFKKLAGISGYPVKIKGSFYTRKISTSEEEVQEEKKPTGLTGLKSSLFKSAQKAVMKKKGSESEGFKLALSYSITTDELTLDSINRDKFKVPSGYKKKNVAALKK